MIIKLIAWPYKVRSAVPGWKGWRLRWKGFEILEPCEFWAEYEKGTFDFPPPQGLGANDPRYNNDEFIDDYYPLCDPAGDPCKCCYLGRIHGNHRHTGWCSGDKPIGRSPFRYK